MQTESEILAHANAVGLVTRREVLGGVVSVRSATPSGHVHAVLVHDRPVGYIKEPQPGSSRGADVVARERTALLSLGDVDLGPRLLAEQPADALWVGVVSGRNLLHVSATIPELAEICETWGVAVARLHQLSTSRPGVPVAPRPWLLDADRRARVAGRSGRGCLHAAVLLAMDGEPGLREAGRVVEARWSDRSWIHGGLTPDNVLVQAAPPVRVRFLDFENAGLGDPAWDLATAADTITWLARRRRTPAEPLVDYFLRGYRRGGGHGTLYPAVQAVRALATAYQLLGGDLAPADPQLAAAELRFWLDRARSFAGRAVLACRDAA